MRVQLFVIECSYSVRLVLTTRCRNLVPMALFWGFGLCPWSPTVALHILLNSGCRSCGHILTQDGQRYNKPLNLVSRGTQISYSTAVNLVAELGYHRWYQSFRFDLWLELVDSKRVLARLRDFVGHKYYFTLPIGECKDVGELMMSSTRYGEQ
ncbi:hypothetical protein M9H77_16647 [Catharanthus roseus]|uniref:Uncharacterized protein n=1 Tax=Catharanthus roseus TaxID=4058 RepID=A0ACC0B2D4_CATRO|nr:hypothetical protein M9H77_16647 [Catharanthus roseus]